MKQNKTFNEQCYALLRQIPKGKVTTYKEIARAMGTKAWRAVGSTLAKNPDLITTPCHRVVLSDGHIGEYALGKEEKKKLLQSEGIKITDNKIENFEECFYTFI